MDSRPSTHWAARLRPLMSFRPEATKPMKCWQKVQTGSLTKGPEGPLSATSASLGQDAGRSHGSWWQCDPRYHSFPRSQSLHFQASLRAARLSWTLDFRLSAAGPPVPVPKVQDGAASSLPLELPTVGLPTDTPASKLATEEGQASGRVFDGTIRGLLGPCC